MGIYATATEQVTLSTVYCVLSLFFAGFIALILAIAFVIDIRKNRQNTSNNI